MERVHYRRHTPSKLNRDDEESPKYHLHPAEEPTTAPESSMLIEKLAMQGIISGIILAVVLVLNLMDNSMAVGIRTNLNAAISEHITAEQVATEVRRFLGESETSGYAEYEMPVYNPSDSLMTEPIINPNIELSPNHNPRIDEDMLREILGYTDIDDLQSTAPEPMITPPEL